MTPAHVITIDSPEDERIACFRNVRDRDLMRRDLFMAEGRLVVRALLTRSRMQTRAVLVTPVAFDDMRDALDDADAPVYVAPQEIVNDIVGFDMHRGCLAAGVRPADTPLDEFLDDVAARGGRRLLLLEDLTNHDNVGALFRTAAAFGAAGVILTRRCCDPLYRKAVRVSMGAALRLPWTTVDNATVALTALHERNWTTVALTPAPDAHDLHAMPRDEARAALLLGEEGPGLSDRAMSDASVRVRIPIRSDIDSLNVAAAGAVALHWFAETS